MSKSLKWTRFALIAIVLMLVSTLAFGLSYAKYLTNKSESGSSVVANWGVEINTSGTLLSDSYIGTAGANTVQASVVDKLLVAPGTDGSVTFDVQGAPEVSVLVALSGSIDYVDGWAIGETGISYNPIVFTLKINDGAVIDYATMEALQAALTAENTEFDANDTINVSFTIGWKWKFENSTVPTVYTNGTLFSATEVAEYHLMTADELDTYMANKETKPQVSISFSCTATQVD